MTSRPFEELVAIGRIVKPQGRRGEVIAEPLSDRPERFPSLKRAYLPGPGGGSHEVTVTSCWPHKGRFVLKLDGVDSIDSAEALRGAELRIGEEELPLLPAGSYYHHQLKGLRVREADGRSLGAIEDIWDTGAGAPVLVVRGRTGENLVPLAEGFVTDVDLEGRVVTVTPRDWVDAGAD
jgi:16S rRNA processing protein RimM